MRFLVFCLAGCATPTSPLSTPPADLAVARDLMGDAPDLLMMVPDLARPIDLASTTPDLASQSGDLATAAACWVRINEVATGTTASGLEEFVELYNPCGAAISLAQHKLVYRAAAGSSDVVLVADLQVAVSQGGFAVFARGSYYSSVRQGALASGLAEAGGGIAVRGPSGAILDSMAWGTATNAFAVGAACAAPQDKAAPGRSLARSPDGTGDFQLTNRPTPGAVNQIQ